jgi:hypothetical protein
MMYRAVIVVAMLAAMAGTSGGETKIGPRGQVIVNGKPTIPVAMWSQPPYLFEYHRQLGMTCMVGAHVERGEFRDASHSVFPPAEKSGLMLVTEYHPADREQKAVIGWLGGNITPDDSRPESLRQENDRIRQADPSRLVMNNLSIHELLAGGHEEYYRRALRDCEAMISHVWPEVFPAKPNLRNVAVMIDRVRELSKDRPGGEISIWPDLNPHHWHNKASRGGTQYPSPTREELRFQIWLALIHGADGICFFPISFDPFVYSQIPATNEQELAWNTKLIQRLTPALTSEESPLGIKVTSDREGGVLDVTTRTVDGKHYVFLVNGGREEQTVTLTVPELGKTWLLRDAVKEQAIDVGSDAFREKLPGLALRIWELVPTKASEATPPAGAANVSSPRPAENK